MAQQVHLLDRERFCCSICLDLLRDPVTVPCGHNYCRSCIETHWDQQSVFHSCPQCRRTFTPRPVLERNTMLADLVEDLKKAGEHQASLPDHCYAGAADVACDVCTGRKIKAIKSCLVCLASYCELHLLPHYGSQTFQAHRLVDASANLRENICPRHQEVMKMFCRTDRRCICYLCTVDDHHGHDAVSAAVEWMEKQRELEGSRLDIRQRLQDRRNNENLLQQNMKDIIQYANGAMQQNEQIFSQLLRLMEVRYNNMKQQVTSQYEIEEKRVRELQEALKQEVAELEEADARLETLSSTEDHVRFLTGYAALPALTRDTPLAQLPPVQRPQRHFEDMVAALSAFRDKLQAVLMETNVSQGDALVVPAAAVKVAEVAAAAKAAPAAKAAQLMTRDKFLRYSCDIMLDPNTANQNLVLSRANRKVRCRNRIDCIRSPLSVSEHPDRFTEFNQVLSSRPLPSRCYWEVEWSNSVYVGVSYKTRDSEFGYNCQSWGLRCDDVFYKFQHNRKTEILSVPKSSRVGVYLDQSAGVLCFYCVSDSMTLLHRVQTRFTHPLYAGLRLDYDSVAELGPVSE